MVMQEVRDYVVRLGGRGGEAGGSMLLLTRMRFIFVLPAPP